MSSQPDRFVAQSGYASVLPAPGSAAPRAPGFEIRGDGRVVSPPTPFQIDETRLVALPARGGSAPTTGARFEIRDGFVVLPAGAPPQSVAWFTESARNLGYQVDNDGRTVVLSAGFAIDGHVPVSQPMEM